MGGTICCCGSVPERVCQGIWIEYGSGLAYLELRRFETLYRLCVNAFWGGSPYVWKRLASSQLGGGFEKVWEQTKQAIADYSEHERAAILGGTAAKFYGIQAE